MTVVIAVVSMVRSMALAASVAIGYTSDPASWGDWRCLTANAKIPHAM